MVEKLSEGYKKSPEYKLLHAVYQNWRLAVPRAIERGINLKQYIDFAEKYDAIDTTDSETYTQICEYFVKAHPANLHFIESDRFNLNAIQKERIMSAVHNNQK